MTISKKRHILHAAIVGFCLFSMAYVWPDAEQVNALPVVKVKAGAGCNSCHEGVTASR